MTQEPTLITAMIRGVCAKAEEAGGDPWAVYMALDQVQAEYKRQLVADQRWKQWQAFCAQEVLAVTEQEAAKCSASWR